MVLVRSQPCTSNGTHPRICLVFPRFWYRIGEKYSSQKPFPSDRLLPRDHCSCSLAYILAWSTTLMQSGSNKFISFYQCDMETQCLTVTCVNHGDTETLSLGTTASTRKHTIRYRPWWNERKKKTILRCKITDIKISYGAVSKNVYS